MFGIKDILKLIQNESGKIFVIDESGQVKFVILSLKDYESLKIPQNFAELSKRVETLSTQAEDLNRIITQAQIEEGLEPVADEVEQGTEEEKAESESLYIEPIEDG
jgi:PHD/YefM family antitoxin component YafN of YafNO toxin-antitoxin module